MFKNENRFASFTPLDNTNFFTGIIIGFLFRHVFVSEDSILLELKK